MNYEYLPSYVLTTTTYPPDNGTISSTTAVVPVNYSPYNVPETPSEEVPATQPTSVESCQTCMTCSPCSLECGCCSEVNQQIPYCDCQCSSPMCDAATYVCDCSCMVQQPSTSSSIAGDSLAASSSSLSSMSPLTTATGVYASPMAQTYSPQWTGQSGNAASVGLMDQPQTDQAMFFGRHESYPPELNRLINPTSCDLCKVCMNSLRSAKDHFESRSHDRNLTHWLIKTYARRGLSIPNVKRFHVPIAGGFDSWNCDSCHVNFTSISDANQHFSGKRHQLRLLRDNITQRMENLDRAQEQQQGIFIPRPNVSNALPSSNRASLYCFACDIYCTSSTQMMTHLSGTKHERNMRLRKRAQCTTSAVCDVGSTICNQTTDLNCNSNSINSPTNTTSANINDSNSRTYMSQRPNSTGSNGVFQHDTTIPLSYNPCTEGRTSAYPVNELIIPTSTDNSDETEPPVPLYRTPSGSYYCKICNKSMRNLRMLQQHLVGKLHIRTEFLVKQGMSVQGQGQGQVHEQIQTQTQTQPSYPPPPQKRIYQRRWGNFKSLENWRTGGSSAKIQHGQSH